MFSVQPSVLAHTLTYNNKSMWSLTHKYRIISPQLEHFCKSVLYIAKCMNLANINFLLLHWCNITGAKSTYTGMYHQKSVISPIVFICVVYVVIRKTVARMELDWVINLILNVNHCSRYITMLKSMLCFMFITMMYNVYDRENIDQDETHLG